MTPTQPHDDVDLPFEMITVERWWAELCAEHGQDPGDPDAFCFHPSAELGRLVEAAKQRWGDDKVEAKTYVP